MNIAMAEPQTLIRILVTGPFSVEESSLSTRLRNVEELCSRNCCGYDTYCYDWIYNNIILVNLREEVFNGEYVNVYEKMISETVTKPESTEQSQTILLRIKEFETNKIAEMKKQSKEYLVIYFGFLPIGYLPEIFFNQHVYFIPPISSLLAHYYHKTSNSYYDNEIVYDYTRRTLYFGPQRARQEGYGEYPREKENSKNCRVLSNVEISNIYTIMATKLLTYKDPKIFNYGGEVVAYLTGYIQQNFK